jgi:hypothetical protein
MVVYMLGLKKVCPPKDITTMHWLVLTVTVERQRKLEEARQYLNVVAVYAVRQQP